MHKWFHRGTQRAALRLLLVCVGVTLLAGAVFVHFERNSQFMPIRSIWDAIWWASVFLISGLENPPSTTAGRIVGLTLVVFGGATVSLVTGYIASVLVERRLRFGERRRIMQLTGHIVICGWNGRARALIDELHADGVGLQRPIVVLAKGVSGAETDDPNVLFVEGDCTLDDDLERANIAKAETAVVLASLDQGEEQTSDARALLATLSIETLNPQVYTCVEVIDPQNIQHLKYAHADEIICMSDFSGRLLGQAALNHGSTAFVSELMGNGGNEMYTIDVPESFFGRKFGELLAALYADQGAIIVAVERHHDKAVTVVTNPEPEFTFAAGDRALVIARRMPQRLDTVR